VAHLGVAYAPAPHTLYTTHADAVRALLESARTYGARTSLHLAEHPSERRAIEEADGPVVTWLEARLRAGSTGQGSLSSITPRRSARSLRTSRSST